jgi:CheY-like chemotaxis protein
MSEIVLVDDNADHVDLMLLALRALGIKRKVVTFASGDACVAAIEQGRVTPGLILIDVNMPRLDGPQTVKRLRGLRAVAMVPIVMLSTSEQVTDVRRARTAGADSYVIKPRENKTWQELMATLTRYWLDTDLSGRA